MGRGSAKDGAKSVSARESRRLNCCLVEEEKFQALGLHETNVESVLEQWH